MQRAEMIETMGWVMANFPNMQEKNVVPTIDLWMRMFADVPKETFEKAVARVMATSRFFPTVADIMENLSDRSQPLAIEAWAEVYKAIKRYGYIRPEEAMNAMSPLARKVVEAIGWMDICASEEPEVVRGQFMNHYATLAARTERIGTLPNSLLTDYERNLAKQTFAERVRAIVGGDQGDPHHHSSDSAQQ